MRAHWRPSLMAHTISDWPRRASPAANTPSTDVVYGLERLHVPARVPFDTELVEQALLWVQEAHREQHELCRKLALGARTAANGGPGSACAIRSARRPRPPLSRQAAVVDREVLLSDTQRAGLLHRVAEAILQRPLRPRRAVVGPVRRRLGREARAGRSSGRPRDASCRRSPRPCRRRRSRPRACPSRVIRSTGGCGTASRAVLPATQRLR